MAKKTTLSKSAKELIGKAFDPKTAAKGRKGSKYHNCITSNLGRGVSYADAQKACKTSTSGKVVKAITGTGIISKVIKKFRGSKKKK